MVDLLREVGFDDSYFVDQSSLVGDEGQIFFFEKQERSSFGGGGGSMHIKDLRAENFGLTDDLGEFSRKFEDDQDTDQYFLYRTYSFSVLKRGEKRSLVGVWVSFAKKTEDDDWKLVHECVIDHRREGEAKWVIVRNEKRRSRTK